MGALTVCRFKEGLTRKRVVFLRGAGGDGRGRGGGWGDASMCIVSTFFTSIEAIQHMVPSNINRAERKGASVFVSAVDTTSTFLVIIFSKSVN